MTPNMKRDELADAFIESRPVMHPNVYFCAGYDAAFAEYQARLKIAEEALERAERRYTQAVKGRKDFRDAFRKEKQNLKLVEHLLEEALKTCGEYFDAAIVGGQEIREALAKIRGGG